MVAGQISSPYVVGIVLLADTSKNNRGQMSRMLPSPGLLIVQNAIISCAQIDMLWARSLLRDFSGRSVLFVHLLPDACPARQHVL